MSVTEILQELPKLSPEDRDLLRQELAERYIADFEETPEMLAAIDEGLRSLREERTYTLEELREEMHKWRLDSK
jgi:predicted transcriptional regulator